MDWMSASVYRIVLLWVSLLVAPASLPAQMVTNDVEATDYDPFLGAVRIKTYSFETQDDQDFDGQPDDWSRRKGPMFPRYIKSEIDRKVRFGGNQSLRIDANGGMAAYYSPPRKIDSLHSYVFEGRMRTDGLKHDAGIISVSFLNHRRQRVQRYLSQPISGTSSGWTKIQIGPVSPNDDVRFVVLGCHLVHSEQMDIEGSVWFDEIWMGRLPKFGLVSNFETHFRKANANIQIRSLVSGLDPGPNDKPHRYTLHLEMNDVDGVSRGKVSLNLKPDPPLKPYEVPPPREPATWELEPQEPGYYRVRSRLQRDDDIIVDRQTSFVVLELVKDAGDRGEFGWSMPGGRGEVSVDDLVDISSESGINWLKYPLWQQAYDTDAVARRRNATVLADLGKRGVKPIGLLNTPPAEIRRKFAADWHGVSEIFTMPPSFWRPTVDDVMANFSTSVHIWQLGGDRDRSFVGLSKLTETLDDVKREFDRIGRDTQIGLVWDPNIPVPQQKNIAKTYLTIESSSPKDADQIIPLLKESEGSGFQRWVLLRPIPKDISSFRSQGPPAEIRAADLVRRIVLSKVGGAEGIFASDVFHPETGLLYEDGSPSELFLPWRTTALNLKNAEFIGSLRMPEGSTNYVFSRNGQALIVMWNKKSVVEEMFLGDDVELVTMWGGKKEVPRDQEGRQIIEVGPFPIILANCNDAVARWRLALKFERGKLPSSTEYHSEAIIGKNTFPYGLGGTITFSPPRDWEVDPRQFQIGLAKGDDFRFPMYIKLPASTSLGKKLLPLEFNLDDGEMKFRVYRDYEIGIGDVRLRVNVIPGKEPNQLIVEQYISNHTNPPELLDFRCSMDARGKKRQYKFVTKLSADGQEVRKSYIVNNANELSEKVFKIRAEQVDGRRVLNYIWRPEE